MRKMFLIVLSLVIVSMFVVGCGTGQALKNPIQKSPPIDQKKSVPSVFFVHESDFREKLGEMQARQLQNGDNACKAMGYSGCIAGVVRAEETAWTSKDGSCKGELSFRNYDSRLEPCLIAHLGLGVDNGCTTAEFGDRRSYIVLEGAFCTK